MQIGWSKNLLVAVINSTGMLVTMWGGKQLRPYLPPVLGSYLAGCVFIALGLWELLRLANVARMRRGASDAEAGGGVELAAKAPGAQECKEPDVMRPRSSSEDRDFEALVVDDDPAADFRDAPPRPPPPDSWLGQNSCIFQAGECVLPTRADMSLCDLDMSDKDFVARARGGTDPDDGARMPAPSARARARGGDDDAPSTPFHGWFTKKSLGSEVNLAALCDPIPPPPQRRSLARPTHKPTIPRPEAISDPEAPCADDDAGSGDDAVEADAAPRRPQLMRRISYVGLGRTPPLVRNFLLITSALQYLVPRWMRRKAPPPAAAAAEPAEDPEPEPEVKNMGTSEAFVLGLALTLSNIAAGIAAGMANLPIPLTVAATLACSFFFMLAGQVAGNAFRKNAQRHCHFGHDEISAASAVIFVTVGVLFLPIVG